MDWFFLALALLSAALFLAGSRNLFVRLFCPFQVNQGEAINVEYARLLFEGTLYQDPSQGPFIHPTYPPLFLLLQKIVQMILPGPWLPGRFLAFLGYGGCGVLLLLWGWRHWDKKAATALALLFLLSPTWAAWGTMVRADTMAIFLEFGAFLLLTHVETSSRIKNGGEKILVLAGLITAVAILCKQNAAILLLAYGLCCVIQREMRRLLIFTASTVMPVLLVFWYFQASSHGFFLKEIGPWLAYGYEPEILFNFLKNNFVPENGWLLAGVAASWAIRETSLLSRCQMLGVTLTLLELGRKTGAENYYLEFVLYGFFFLGEAWLKPTGKKTGIRWFLSKGWLAVLLLVGFACFNQRPWPSLPSREEMAMKQKAAEIYSRPGEHLALDPDLPLMAGKHLWLQPAEYTALVTKGYITPEPLIDDIRAGKFSTIELYDIPRQYLLPQAVVDEVSRSYQVSLRAFGRVWYVPR